MDKQSEGYQGPPISFTFKHMYLLILRSLLWDRHRPFHFTDEQRDSQVREDICSLSQLGSVNAWLQSKKHFHSHTAPYTIIHYHQQHQDHCHHCVSWLPVREWKTLRTQHGVTGAHLNTVILHEDQLTRCSTQPAACLKEPSPPWAPLAPGFTHSRESCFSEKDSSERILARATGSFCQML